MSSKQQGAGECYVVARCGMRSRSACHGLSQRHGEELGIFPGKGQRVSEDGPACRGGWASSCCDRLCRMGSNHTQLTVECHAEDARVGDDAFAVAQRRRPKDQVDDWEEWHVASR